MSEAREGERVLVTGGLGFLGRHVVSRLHGEGTPVLILDLPDAGREGVPADVEVVAADLTDTAAYAPKVSGFAPTHVLHLAALIDNRREIDLYDRLFEVNLGGTKALARTLVECGGVQGFVHASTGEEYGVVEGIRHEELPARPVSPYSASKAAVTAFLISLHRMTGFPAVTARMFLPYGPGASPRFFVQQVLAAIERDEPFEMTTGEQKRDLLYIDDVVEGLLRVARCPGLAGDVVNLCSGQGVSMLEIAGTAEAVAREAGKLGEGFRIEAGKLPYRKAEIMEYVGDPGKLERLTGFKARVGLREGLGRMIGKSSSGFSKS